jgi:hypothetical protein
MVAVSLLFFLSKKISVICQFGPDYYYYFHDGKVSEYRADDHSLIIARATMLRKRGDSRVDLIPALCNADVDTPRPARGLCYRGAFVVQFTSPQKSRYKEWAKVRNAHKFWMANWSVDEIADLS